MKRIRVRQKGLKESVAMMWVPAASADDRTDGWTDAKAKSANRWSVGTDGATSKYVAVSDFRLGEKSEVSKSIGGENQLGPKHEVKYCVGCVDCNK